jgi:paraquat-inducible protein A
LLDRGHRIGLQGQLALSVAALIVFMLANAFPIVTLDLRGMRSTVTLLDAIAGTWQAGEQAIALLAAATAFAFPLAVIVLRLVVLVPLVMRRRPEYFDAAMRALLWTTHWAMAEVFVLGALIAVVRSASLATITLGIGLVAYAVLTVLLTAIHAGGVRRLWQRAAESPA